MLPALLAAVAFLPALAAQPPEIQRSTAAITIIHPSEGMVLPASEGAFVLGSVSDPKGTFQINGQTVPVRSSGAFLAWLPVGGGTFTFNGSLTLSDKTTAFLQRTVFVTSTPAPMPEKPLAIDKDSLSPKVDLELRPGDWLLVRMRATPGQKARFRLPRHSWQPMRETGGGNYEGAYLVGAGEQQDPAPVEFALGSGWSAIEAKSAGLAALSSGPPPVAVAKGETLVGLKTGNGEGELFRVLPGARFLTAGRAGLETKVLLSGGQSGWVDTKNLVFLPPGSPPPRAVTDTLSIKSAEGWTAVRIGLSDRVPFTVDESDDLRSLTVRLHYAVSHTNWIVYDSGDPLIEEARVRQEAEGLVAVKLRVKPGKTIWGFHASYDGSSVKIELREPPKAAAAPASPLTDLKVFIDPGHMPSAPGAVGALGTLEMDANYAIAKDLEARLRQEGAVPILSRRSKDDEVALNDRPRLAWEAKADLYVSVHNNFLPSGTNPFKGTHGFSVFYYQPHSLKLARETYRAYQKLVPLPGEDLRFGNLLVLRGTEMPAILTESAYLTYPEQEELLNAPDFQGKLAQAMLEGLRAFMEEERARQPAPAAKPAVQEKPEAPPKIRPKAAPAKKKEPGPKRAKKGT